MADARFPPVTAWGGIEQAGDEEELCSLVGERIREEVDEAERRRGFLLTFLWVLQHALGLAEVPVRYCWHLPLYWLCSVLSRLNANVGIADELAWHHSLHCQLYAKGLRDLVAALRHPLITPWFRRSYLLVPPTVGVLEGTDTPSRSSSPVAPEADVVETKDEEDSSPTSSHLNLLACANGEQAAFYFRSMFLSLGSGFHSLHPALWLGCGLPRGLSYTPRQRLEAWAARTRIEREAATKQLYLDNYGVSCHADLVEQWKKVKPSSSTPSGDAHATADVHGKREATHEEAPRRASGARQRRSSHRQSRGSVGSSRGSDSLDLANFANVFDHYDEWLSSPQAQGPAAGLRRRSSAAPLIEPQQQK